MLCVMQKFLQGGNPVKTPGIRDSSVVCSMRIRLELHMRLSVATHYVGC